MKIAVLSDSHDNIANLDQAISMVKELGILHGFHLGDFCTSGILKRLAETGMAWQCVWGNNDTVNLAKYQPPPDSGVTLAKEKFVEVQPEGRKVLLTHFPKVAAPAAASGGYNAVFFGHNHRYSQELVGQTLLANPGEILGKRFGHPSFGVYDTADNSFQHYFLPVKKERR